jgi:hypothetical protein
MLENYESDGKSIRFATPGSKNDSGMYLAQSRKGR